MMVRPVCALLWFLAGTVSPAVAQDDYRFDVTRFEKKPFEWNGYTELRIDQFHLDPDAALSRLNVFNQAARSRMERITGALELSGIYRRGIASFQATVHGEATHDRLASGNEANLYEGYLAVEPASGMRFEAGKRALRWGKGYAWNPVGFVERPKDPNDPELSREGFALLAANMVRSDEGPLKTVTFTPLIVPTRASINKGFGTGSHINPAARLSLLYRDTDIDMLWLGSGARNARYGVAFARNLAANVEVHGEWARIGDNRQPVLSSTGSVTQRTSNATSYLLGLRYLSERDTTWIIEYYRNGAGYTEQEMRDYFNFVHDAYDRFAATGNAAALERARAVQAAYARPNPARRYLYLRASQKEPFDVLYFTPAVTAIVNLDDRSRSLAPEFSYTGITNLDLRLRLLFLYGGRLADFGEKQNDRRIELRARLSF